MEHLGHFKQILSRDPISTPPWLIFLVYLKIAELYGNDQKNFDYWNAPERGRLEGTRDFTDKPVYR